MEVIFFAGLVLLAFWAFSKTTYADEKPLAVTERADATWGVPITICLVIVLLFLLAGLTGNAVSGSAYDVVAQTGDADLLNAFILASIVGCIGGLLLVNGIARPIGLILLLGGIFLSVAITAGVQP